MWGRREGLGVGVGDRGTGVGTNFFLNRVRLKLTQPGSEGPGGESRGGPKKVQKEKLSYQTHRHARTPWGAGYPAPRGGGSWGILGTPPPCPLRRGAPTLKRALFGADRLWAVRIGREDDLPSCSILICWWGITEAKKKLIFFSGTFV